MTKFRVASVVVSVTRGTLPDARPTGRTVRVPESAVEALAQGSGHESAGVAERRKPSLAPRGGNLARAKETTR